MKINTFTNENVYQSMYRIKLFQCREMERCLVVKDIDSQRNYIHIPAPTLCVVNIHQELQANVLSSPLASTGIRHTHDAQTYVQVEHTYT